MGYRSDVAYTIRFDHDDDRYSTQSFYTFLGEIKSKPELAPALGQARINELNRCIDFEARSVRWYETLPEVASHDALIALAQEWCDDDETGSMWYVFARIGEDFDDVEYQSGGERRDLSVIEVKRELVTGWRGDE